MKMTQRKWLTALWLAGFSTASCLVIAATPDSKLSLKNEPRPEPPDLMTKYVYDKQALIALGKALFWDMQVGSDGVQACASCHFHAGADNRSKNQLNPGTNRAQANTALTGDTTFSKGKGPNYQLTAADYPFHRLSDPLNRNSTVKNPPDVTDVASSQGIALRTFVSNTPGCNEFLSYSADNVFHVGGINTRRVEPRHTPTVINAVFNHRNFWDGRAQDIFNGVNHRGAFDPAAHLYQSPPDFSRPVAVQVRIEQSSLASQAVAPPLSNTEMSAVDRSFLKIGKRLVGCKPLAKQLVHPDDSVLGAFSLYNTLDRFGNPTPGLNKANYFQMIREAFRAEWWFSNFLIQVNSDGSETVVDAGVAGPNVYTLIEYNFSLFFGLAIQAYEATLVSDDTPFDRYHSCGATDTACQQAALTGSQMAGMDLFFSNRTRCGNCHRGSALTDASVSQTRSLGLTRLRSLETYTKDRKGNLVVKQRQLQLIDTGFNNLGVRPTLEDLGVGSKFDAGVSASADLSIARRCTTGNCGLSADPCFPAPVLAVDGSFKIPGLRNVELTAPYFHNGGTLNLSDALDFYLRGADFNPVDEWNAQRSTSYKVFPLVTLAGKNFDITADGRTAFPGCQAAAPLNDTPITSTEKVQLLAFLLGLTDERVRNRKAPFDHPELFVPHGHPGNTTSVTSDGFGYATENLVRIPETGRNGGTPLPNFPDFH